MKKTVASTPVHRGHTSDFHLATKFEKNRITCASRKTARAAAALASFADILLAPHAIFPLHRTFAERAIHSVACHLEIKSRFQMNESTLCRLRPASYFHRHDIMFFRILLWIQLQMTERFHSNTSQN